MYSESEASEDDEDEIYNQPPPQRERQETEEQGGVVAYESSYNDLATDVLREAETPAPKEDEHTGKLFDFRRGPGVWPKGVDIVGPRDAQALIAAARAEAEKDTKEDDDDLTTYFDTDVYGPHLPLVETDDDDDDVRKKTTTAEQKAPDGASFRKLKDGSFALEIPPGSRIKLDLTSLVAETTTNQPPRSRRGFSYWDRRPRREFINEYTVTLDVKLEEPPPDCGLSLFQTALVHAEESRGGRRRARESDGEACVNQSGGVGSLGTYGDTAKTALKVGAWQRIVVAVRCAAAGQQRRRGATVKKGELRTYVGATPGAVCRHERISANERFALRSDGLFLFSSRNERMMPGYLQCPNQVSRSCDHSKAKQKKKFFWIFLDFFYFIFLFFC